MEDEPVQDLLGLVAEQSAAAEDVTDAGQGPDRGETGQQRVQAGHGFLGAVVGVGGVVVSGAVGAVVGAVLGAVVGMPVGRTAVDRAARGGGTSEVNQSPAHRRWAGPRAADRVGCLRWVAWTT